MKLIFLSIFLASALHQADSNGYYDKILSHSRIRARKEGPNVCALQQVMGTKKKYFSTCKNWHQGAICGKKATVMYECCPGYMKMNGQQGCPAVAPIDNVYGTLGIVGALATQDYSDRSDLRKEIEGVGSFTFFAPSNDAWDLLDAEIRSSLLSNVNIELLNALHYHMINKRLLTKDLKNGFTFESMLNNEKLLINHYPNGIVTVNCARIIHGNQIATNGVVHVIDRVVTAVGNTIQDFVDAEDDLSSLRAASIASNIFDKLGEPGHYTLFAPTNEAFEKLPRGVLERIMSDKKAAEALVKYHILDTVQCSEAIMGGSVLDNLEGSSLQVGCDGDSLTVNGKKIVNRKDIVTTNGVIHLIDDVLIPDSAKQVLELAGSQQTTFTDLMAQMGLAAAMRPDAEYTLLAPLNDAFSDETLKMDQRVLKTVLQNHVLKSKFILSELYNGQTLETLGGKQLRVFVYRTAVCIENSCMLRGSKEGRNGAIHTFRKIIRPAEQSMYDILSQDRRYSIFLSLIEYADLKDLLMQGGAWTLFAPTNDAFEGLSREDIEILKKDKVALQNILLYHLAPGVFIGDGFEPGVTNIIKSLQLSKLMIKAGNNSIFVNDVPAQESDLMATNGVIHTVKKLLFPADASIGNEQLLQILNKVIKYFTIRFVRGSSFKEIPLNQYVTKLRVSKGPSITKVIGGETVRKVIQEPTITKVTKIVQEPEVKVIQGGETRITKVIQEPTITKVTRVIEGEPDFKLIKEGETQVTRIIQGDPTLTKITRVIEGDQDFKLIKEGGTQVTKVIQGPEVKVTRISGVGGDIDEATLKRMLEEEVTRVSKFIEGDSQLLDDDELKRLLQGGSEISKVTTIVEEPQVRRVQTSRRIQGQPVRRKLKRSHKL
ncbi:periostin-like isoform X4 [Pelobates cultripes]|uniref:Periostin n=1 Tax=Pelobates cultripes TaxID=61616 RepID=A0AAD1VRK7_PELCU|nr:periostin-like isoform X4 [Pelobates cultripes]